MEHLNLDGYKYTCRGCGYKGTTNKDHGATCEHCGRLIEPPPASAPKPMSREYKYFRIVETERKPKTKVYAVINKKSGFQLGAIQWYSAWRQYCFAPAADTIFSDDCMQDIVNFVKEINLEA